MNRTTADDAIAWARDCEVGGPNTLRRILRNKRAVLAAVPVPSSTGLRLAFLSTYLLCYVASTQAGAVYNASTDFDAVNNPSQINGSTFSYGQTASLGSAFTPLGDHVSNSPFVGYDFAAGGGLPEVLKNAGASVSTMVLPGGTITIQPGQLELHPGSSGQYAELRFTAPAAGSYSYSATFNGADSRPTTTDVHVLIDSTLDNAAFINLSGGGNTASFVALVSLPLHGTIDFAVGNGGNGFSFDSTGLFATVTAVPEPSPIALLGIGIAPLAVVARRRTR